MGLKPARTQREPRRAWTRTARRKMKRAYIKGVPDSKIRVFNMGDAKVEDCEITVDLVSHLHCQIRDNALEAARVMANKIFENKIGKENYRFKIRVYPHQALREHAILTGAGADRLSKGMKQAFGRAVGRAAVVKKNQKIMSVWTMEKFEDLGREGIRRAARKVPGNCKVSVSKLK